MSNNKKRTIDRGFKICAMGDVSPGDHYFSLGHGPGELGRQDEFDSVFEHVSSIFSNADIVFCNLEGPLSNHSKETMSFAKKAFLGSKNVAASLKRLGVNVVNIANNHILQHGERAFQDTLDVLTKEKINIVGLKSEGEFSSEPVIIYKDDTSIGMLGYSNITERYAKVNKYYAEYDRDNATQDIRNLKLKVDIVLVSIHVGYESVNIPAPEVVTELKRLSNEGARIILAHHAHVFHPVLNYDQSIVATGLGDAIFDLHWDDMLTDTAILNIYLDDNKNINFELCPVKFTKKNRLEYMCKSDADKFLGNLVKVKELMQKNTYEHCFEKTIRKGGWVGQVKKYLYFMLNIMRGDTRNKLQFIRWKLRLPF